MKYEKTACDWASGEGDSSRTHGLPDSHLDYELLGTRTILKCLKLKSEGRAERTSLITKSRTVKEEILPFLYEILYIRGQNVLTVMNTFAPNVLILMNTFALGLTVVLGAKYK